MKIHYPGFRLRWLTESAGEYTIPASDEDGGHVPLPIAPEMCSGWFEMQRLVLGMTLLHGVHHFTPAAAGKLVPLADFHTAYAETSFNVQTAFGGQFCHHDQHPKVELISGPGRDLFRYGDLIHTQSFLDGTSDSEMVGLTVGYSVLVRLLGEEGTQALMTGLGLADTPAALVRPIPLKITVLLRAAMTTKLQGPARKLFAQAKVLEYLGALLDHVSTEAEAPTPANKRERIRALHDYLKLLDGKLPTLDELAKDYGMSVRVLNNEFTREYGKSIYTFVTDHRLDEAHAALQQSDVPMKNLAIALGYTHVNNFITAFKKKFGYAPGSVRRKSGRD